MIINELEIKRTSLSFMDAFFPAKDYTWIRSEKEHYRLLAYLSKQYNNITILDLGTDTGASCLSLAQNQTNKVITYDIKPRNISFGIQNIKSKTMDFLNEDESVLKSSSLILLDVDPHDGKQEKDLIDKLIKIDFNGIVICDDIYNMGYWWDSVTQEKYDITSVGHFTGTGLINFSKEKIIIKGNEVIKFNLRDDTFNHHTRVGLPDVSVAGQFSDYIEWDRSCQNSNIPTFYTHDTMMNVCTPKDFSYGILFESQSIIPDTYKNIENVIDKFNMIFTHSSYLLNKYENCKWIPGGGIWIGGSYGQGTVGIKPKNKLCSMVSSDKNMCDLHRLRYEIFNSLNSNKVEKLGKQWIRIYKSLDDFMFSIIVENYIDDLYFTEKILNCFATGTIPIYLGARNIDKIFNGNGIIKFNNKHELDSILNNISSQLYYSKIESIKDNYERCFKYKVIEDYIYMNYFRR